MSNLQQQPLYWQSLEELEASPEQLAQRHHEFQDGVTDDFDPDQLTGVSRRRFLAAMGASAAFALTSCKSYLGYGKYDKAVPYNQQPEEVILSRPNYYASTIKTHDDACSVLVTAREGRPVNIKGNPDDPVCQGRISGQFVASIMSLYDPDRLKQPMMDGQKGDWGQADQAVLKALDALKGSGKKAALVTHRVMSPAMAQLLKDFQGKYPADVYSYRFFSEGMRNSAWKKTYRTDSFPAIQWDQADVVLALGSDFLGADADLETQRLFAERRDIMNDKKFTRLYVAEGNMTQTGINADYRLRLRSDAQLEFAKALLNELVGKHGLAAPDEVKNAVSDAALSSVASKHGLDQKIVTQLANDLVKHKGKGMVHAGSRSPETVHIVVNAINEVLGNTKLYRMQDAPVFYFPEPTADDWQQLISDLKGDKIGLVIHMDANPLYHLPKDLGYEDALKKSPLVVSLSLNMDETAQVSKYVLPIHHDLESWGDYKTRAGVHNLQQPVIHPLHDSRQIEGLLLAWMNGDGGSYNEKTYLSYLQKFWQDKVFTKANALVDFKTFWNTALHDGLVTYKESTPSLGDFDTAALVKAGDMKAGNDFVLSLHRSNTMGDGQFANNGWLQEVPHPVSKVVWGNYLAMSAKSAKELGVKTDDMVKVDANGNSVTLPVLVQPGMADKELAIELGYGRTHAGQIGTDVGFNANALLSVKASQNPWILNQVSVSKAGGSHRIVSTQVHHSFHVEREQDLHFKRAIVHEANYEKYTKDPHSAEMHGHKPFNITKSQEYPGIKWAMAIDMNKCNGCNACVVACNVENNVPIIGPEQVERGREMHWIRIDRYYSGTPDEPKVSQQVMLCQHCDNAPCEVVCPVNATNHSPDGLNQMAYNRCVGTRYCSNNCPYKVRRYNFFNYRDHYKKAFYRQDVHQLQHNPEVTVRSRGVMEKCSFCVQRIMYQRQEAIREKRDFKGSDVVTACQEACPSGAIIFGDSNDKSSDVSKYREHVTGYHVLEEFNARPNVTYVAKLRNTSA